MMLTLQLQLTGGTFVFVEQGTTNGDAGFVFTHNGTPTIGTTALTVTQFSGAGSITAGDVKLEQHFRSTLMILQLKLMVVINFKSNDLESPINDCNTINYQFNSKVTGTLPLANGGTGVSSYTAGDLIYYAMGTSFTKLGIACGTFLTTDGTAPSWTSTIDGGTF